VVDLGEGPRGALPPFLGEKIAEGRKAGRPSKNLGPLLSPRSGSTIDLYH